MKKVFIIFFLPLLSLVSSTIIAQDNCSTAIEISDISTYNITFVDLTNRTESGMNSCYTGIDTWYKFEATKKNTNLLIPNDGQEPPIPTHTYVELYDGCNGNLINCEVLYRGWTFEMNDLQIGDEYFIKITLDPGELFTRFALKEACDIQIINLSNSGCDPIDNTYDVTFEITYQDFTLSELNVTVGSDNFFQDISESSGTTTFTITDYFNSYGQTVDITIYHLQFSNFCRAEYQGFIVPPPCVNTPINNECNNPLVIDLDSCSDIDVDFRGATETHPDQYVTGPDLWYSFTATHDYVEFEHVDQPGNRLLRFSFFEACNDNPFYERGTFDNNVFNIPNLIIGNSYILKVKQQYNSQTKIWLYNNQAPAPICTNSLNVSLTNSGTVNIFGTSNAISQYNPQTQLLEEIDDCTALDELVIELNLVEGSYKDDIQFDCSDIGKEMSVYYKVTDESGLSGYCSTLAVVSDPFEVCPCVDDLYVAAIAPLHNYEAEYAILSDAKVNVPTSFSAGEYILLDSEFEVLPNQTFEAFIEACN